MSELVIIEILLYYPNNWSIFFNFFKITNLIFKLIILKIF